MPILSLQRESTHSLIHVDCEDGEIRLAGGNVTAGRVEICFDGIWGQSV